MLVCLACSKNLDAEVCHPLLRIPICGACDDALKDADKSIVNENIVSCVWCGWGDGSELFMCDTCDHSFCTECVTRNFGKAESIRVRKAQVWACYTCISTPKFESLQLPADTVFYNIEKTYHDARPINDNQPYVTFDEHLVAELTPNEQNLAVVFCSGILNHFKNLDIAENYLKAYDILSVLYRISPALRRFFKSKVFLTPGLFKTEYGVENLCKLHPHQLVGLDRLQFIENRTTEFGALRGGIFGDEPGLGKTVTCLALIASSAGTMPLIADPDEFVSDEVLEAQWQIKKEASDLPMHFVTGLFRKSFILDELTIRKLRYVLSGVWLHRDTLLSFKSYVNKCVRDVAANDLVLQDKLMAIYRLGMSRVREDLFRTRSTRSLLGPPHPLVPSAGTLIIVPQALLEHWYEQIRRHLNLEYFARTERQPNTPPTTAAGDIMEGTELADHDDDGEEVPEGRDEHCRGLVYMYGLGDIVDIVPPLNKLQDAKMDDNKDGYLAEILSHYMIVVTTFERCAVELKSGAGCLLGIRWLRMVLDEGHEMSQSKDKNKKDKLIIFEDSSTAVNQFISCITAERRWIMSGTPTTGAKSELALIQLHRLLTFLKHPMIRHYDSRTAGVYNFKTGLIDPAEPGTVKSHNSRAYWNRSVKIPCLQQNPEAWEMLTDLLRPILVRHSKNDLHLYDPIVSTVNLERIYVADGIMGDRDVRSVDRALAQHIISTMLKADSAYADHKNKLKLARRVSYGSPLKVKDGSCGAVCGSNSSEKYTPEEVEQFKARRPKAIVFSQHFHNLQGVSHFLYTQLGDAYLCEHWGAYQSSELSRFRNSMHKYRRCPLCGYCNSMTDDKFCFEPLLLVEYLDIAPPIVPVVVAAPVAAAVAVAVVAAPVAAPVAAADDGVAGQQEADPAVVEEPPIHPPQWGGHGAAGPGGHFTGLCLCSPEGCPPGFRRNNGQPRQICGGYPNPFAAAGLNIGNQNLAIISNDHVFGWNMGQGAQAFVQGQIVRVNHLPASNVEEGVANSTPLLWQGGILGGRAVIRQWRRCGGKNAYNSWHGERVLERVPWQVEHQPASIMLLKEDGSTGLDLSFATHIFLLERIKDPALRNQIVSRAHRMGATGPVEVQLLQVKVEEDSDL